MFKQTATTLSPTNDRFLSTSSLNEQCNETLPGSWPIIEDTNNADSCSSAKKMSVNSTAN